MKVAVKKSVLFNLLKKRLNENRGLGDHGGRLIHPFNIQSPNSDPFGIYDDDLPIKSSSHMASQLSIEQPPVDDEDYIPGTINELCAAASVIAKVTRDQIMIFKGKKNKIYKWDKNKGYGTNDHLLAIKKYGITNFHRKTFNLQI